MGSIYYCFNHSIIHDPFCTSSSLTEWVSKPLLWPLRARRSGPNGSHQIVVRNHPERPLLQCQLIDTSEHLSIYEIKSPNWTSKIQIKHISLSIEMKHIKHTYFITCITFITIDSAHALGIYAWGMFGCCLPSLNTPSRHQTISSLVSCRWGIAMTPALFMRTSIFFPRPAQRGALPRLSTPNIALLIWKSRQLMGRWTRPPHGSHSRITPKECCNIRPLPTHSDWECLDSSVAHREFQNSPGNSSDINGACGSFGLDDNKWLIIFVGSIW